ncbi:MAG: adenine deaminase [Oscillospiraceae bacterium]|nr:adenine deaminase [Oscillospiraceae bacterium]
MAKESYAGKINRKFAKKVHVVEVAAGREEADLVLKNATYVNVFCNELSHGDIAVAGGLIAGMGEEYHGKVEVDVGGKLVLPGFVDAHIHLESSLVSPTEFVKAVLPHGTTTVVTDPHEITNVMGTDGIEYILQATEGLPVDVRVMLPSCVPATPLDESGASLDYRAIDSFYEHGRVEGLAEMMNFVGVVGADEQVLQKIVAAQAHHKKIDGHAPNLSGNDLNAYIAAGVYSDHECSDIRDALAKLERGQYIMIREGTAARNLDALLPLLTPQYYTYCMFCTDDKHPNDLLELGHMDYIVKRAIEAGVDPIIAVKCASHHAARYFLLNNRGAVAPGFLADFVIIDNFKDFNILSVYKKGRLMYDGEKLADIPAPEIEPYLVKHAHETFHVPRLSAGDFVETRPRGVLGMVPGEIVTSDAGYADKIDVEGDILKIAVVERHKNTHHIGVGYIKGYGLKSGAVATSISHDSHNIIVVGTNEEDMAAAVNRVVALNGGIVVWDGGEAKGELQLEIAGIMSEEPLKTVNDKLEKAKEAAFALGVSRGVDPFMTLSFMALPVIPTLRLTTRGVFDVDNQRYV